MKNIRIVVDSTSGMSPEFAKEHRIDLIALSVEIDGKEYRDNIDISKEEFYQCLKRGALPTTSQPNIGYLRDEMAKWSEDDGVIVITISSYLSGTYQGFHLMKQELGLDNVTIIDSKTAAGPMIDAALCAREMADHDASVAEIEKVLEEKFQNTTSFVYPATLTQLKRGGRISPVAANMASLLKIKPLLMLKKDGTIIDKYGMARTENKIFEMIVSHLMKEGVSAKTHRLYIPHAQGKETADRCIAYIREHMGDMEIFTSDLPAVLTAHAGLGCIAVQSAAK